MNGFLCEHCIWTLRDIVGIPENCSGCCCYREKKGKESCGKYARAREEYDEKRGAMRSIKPKRQDRLLENLKDFEVLLESQEVIAVDWRRSNRDIYLFLSNGFFVRLELVRNQCDLSLITVDKSLASKINGRIQSAAFGASYLVCSAVNSLDIHFVSFSSSGTKTGKISLTDARVSSITLPLKPCTDFGCSPIFKEFVVNDSSHCVVVLLTYETWLADAPHLYNVVVCGVNNGQLELLAHLRTSYPATRAFFRAEHRDEFYVLEEVDSGIDCVQMIFARYSLNRSAGARLLDEHCLQLGTNPVSCLRHPDLDLTLLVLEDGAVCLHDTSAQVTLQTHHQPSIRVAGACWHPQGGVVLLWDTDGSIQLLDLGLTTLPLCMQESSLQITAQKQINVLKYFRCNKSVRRCFWNLCPKSVPSFYQPALILYDHGPVSVLRVNAISLDPLSLVHLHCQNDSTTAVEGAAAGLAVLRNLSWNRQTELASQVMILLTNRLLMIARDDGPQSLKLLEQALATFFVPERESLQQNTLEQCRQQLQLISRRLFYAFLHADLLEKATLLASDLKEPQLFASLRQVAARQGDRVLAEVTRGHVAAALTGERETADEQDPRHWFAEEELAVPSAENRARYFAMEDRLVDKFRHFLNSSTTK